MVTKVTLMTAFNTQHFRNHKAFKLFTSSKLSNIIYTVAAAQSRSTGRGKKKWRDCNGRPSLCSSQGPLSHVPYVPLMYIALGSFCYPPSLIITLHCVLELSSSLGWCSACCTQEICIQVTLQIKVNMCKPKLQAYTTLRQQCQTGCSRRPLAG